MHNETPVFTPYIGYDGVNFPKVDFNQANETSQWADTPPRAQEDQSALVADAVCICGPGPMRLDHTSDTRFDVDNALAVVGRIDHDQLYLGRHRSDRHGLKQAEGRGLTLAVERDRAVIPDPVRTALDTVPRNEGGQANLIANWTAHVNTHSPRTASL